ncbi:hypothetical protein [Bacillus sp. FJAT-29937]|uniref:hypothetical protein n=1 Tax=Bacillus sp. FJAT-29937 TaxID=1720553 RepID=UPI000836B21C|nr:hypothetical protein [Bacillus sp. FJAT-29937]
MKKSFSQLNLLQKKLSNIGEKSWFDNFFTSKYRFIELKLPLYEYLRGKVFIEDIVDLYEEEEESIDISINQLIDILYIDFLSQIKKGVSFENMANYLVSKKQQYLSPPTSQKRIMKRVNTNLFTFKTVEEEVSITPEEESQHAYITLKIKEAALLRGEVFLHDLTPYLAGHSLQIEEVIIILYLDFIEKIKDKGNNLEVMKAIVNRLE